MPKQQIMRILGAAIVLIALSFAPSVAQAHTSSAISTRHPFMAARAKRASVSHASERSATSASLQQAQWKQAGMLPASDRNCTGGCCLFACAACCAAGLPSPVAFVAFPRAITRVAFAPVTDVAATASPSRSGGLPNPSSESNRTVSLRGMPWAARKRRQFRLKDDQYAFPFRACPACSRGDCGSQRCDRPRFRPRGP